MEIINILNSPWAIVERYLDEIQQVYSTHFRGDKIDLSAFASPERDKEKNSEFYQNIGGVAVIDISGPLVKRLSIFEFFFGGTSFSFIQNAVKTALADDLVKNVLLKIDSPGGTVNGTMETAELIYESRGVKPIIAFTDGIMASAAYWIGSAANKVYISGDTTDVGSIGVIMKHADYSKWDAAAGVKYTIIKAGKYKDVGTETRPLSDEDEAILQSEVDYLYTVFVNDIAKHRGQSVKYVLNNMADAKMFIGKQALEPALVDGVISFDNLINILADGDSAESIILVHSNNFLNDKGALIMDLTVDKIKTEHLEIYQSIFDLGVASVNIEKIKTDATAAGAVAEMNRIKGIEAASLPGHEALIEALKFDGHTTGAEAALQIVGAERVMIEGKKRQIEKDAIEAIAQPPAPGIEIGAKENPDFRSMTDSQIMAKCKEIFDADAKIQKEFGSVETYYYAELALARDQVRSIGGSKTKR